MTFNIATTHTLWIPGFITLDTSAYTSGNGGNITVNGTAYLYGGFKASGADTGNGGTITTSGGALTLDPGSIVANGGDTGDGGTVSITMTDSEPVDWSDAGMISITGGATSGDGGNLTISAVSDLTIEGSSINVNALGSGDGGTIDATVGTANNLTISGSLTASVGTGDGDGDGDGGTINLHDNGTLTLGSDSENASFDASAEGSGDGGSITLKANQATLVGGLSVSANGPSSGDGDGGQIDFESSVISLGDSGTPAVTRGSKSVPSLDASIQYIFVANAGSAGGDAKNITFKTDTDMTIGNADQEFQFLANAGPTAGNGGTITINANMSGNPTPTGHVAFDLSAAGTGTPISAYGWDTGLGGHVIISPTLTRFDVNQAITVDAGDAVTGLDGSIKLNGTECMQYKTGEMTWPKTFWDCTANETPTGILSDFAISLASRALLGTNVTYLYTFSDVSGFNAFFNGSGAAGTAGITFPFPATGHSPVYVSLMENTLPNVEQRKEASAHELGHAINDARSFPSDGTTYDQYVLSDFFQLDYSTYGGVTFARNPCVATGSDPMVPPLLGVYDTHNGEMYCTDGLLNDPTGEYSGLSNSAILQIADADVLRRSSGGGWREPFSQAFAWADYAHSNSGDQLLHRTIDEEFGTGFFGCIVSWANAEAGGTAGPPGSPPSYCTESGFVPGWYTPFGPAT